MSSQARIIHADATFNSEGSAIDIVPSSDIAAGSIVVVGKLVGVAKFGIRAGSKGSIAVRGVFDVVKDPTTNIPAGTTLYWSQISWHVVKTPYAHPQLGKAIEAAPPGTLTVRVRLSQ